MKNKYEQLVDIIAESIDREIYKKGEYLPGERTLAKKHGISRVTVRGSMKELVKRHLVKAVPGKGYLVFNPEEEPRKKNYSIGGVWSSSEGDYHSFELFKAASETLEKSNYHLYLSYASGDEKVQANKINALLGKQTDGLLITPIYEKSTGQMSMANHELLLDIQNSGIPVMLFDRPIPETDLPSVTNDDYAGGAMALEHLVANGHKKICYLGLDSKYDYYITQLRYEGFIDACRLAGLEPHPFYLDLYRKGKVVPENFKSEAKSLSDLINKEGITACFINGGMIMDNLVSQLDEAGLKRKLEIVGYGAPSSFRGLLRHDYFELRRPLVDISTKAAANLLSLLDGHELELPQLKIAPKIARLSWGNSIDA